MFQRITIIGHVGQEPQMRYTPQGEPVTNFSVATKQTVSKNKTANCPSGWKESYNGKNWELTTWWRVTCWGKLAETTNEYLQKGMQVFVEGELRGEAVSGVQNPRIWKDRNGDPQASFELTAHNVKFLGSAGDNGATASVGTGQGRAEEDEAEDEYAGF